MRRFFSLFLVLAVAISCIGVMPAVSAAPTEGRESVIDFSKWSTGAYTLEQIASAVKDNGFTVVKCGAGAGTSYSVEYNDKLGRNVLKISNTDSSVDGLDFQADSPYSGKNVTYAVKTMTNSAMSSKGINNKYVLNVSGSPVISGALLKDRTQIYSGGWINPLTGLSQSSWLEETTVINTTDRTYMYITDAGGRYTADGSFKLTSRNAGDVKTVRIYPDTATDSFIAEIALRNYPTVIDSGLYGGEVKYENSSAVSTTSTSAKLTFDHYMDAQTFVSENIKLYNESTGAETAIPQENIAYDAESFTLTVEVGKLSEQTKYKLRLTSGIANTDNISLKPTELAFTSGVNAMELLGVGPVDGDGNILDVKNVIPEKAIGVAVITNAELESAEATVNGDAVQVTINGKTALVPMTLENDSQYEILIKNIRSVGGETIPDQSFTFTTRGSSVDYFFNGFEHISEPAGTMLNAAQLLPENSNVTIAPAGSVDGVFEVIESNGGKAIKVSQPVANRNPYGFKMTFEKDLFSALGNENVVVEMDYYVDRTTASTYAAFARMNNTACLYVQNNVLQQQTKGELKEGINGKEVHYKWTMNSSGTLNLIANGERLALNNSYDIPFRSTASKPTVWEIYIKGGDATYYTMDNLRIRNYPAATLSFLTGNGVKYDNVIAPNISKLYVTFDNTMNEDSITADSIGIYDESGKRVESSAVSYNVKEKRAEIVPAGELEMGKTYEVRIDSGVVNSQNKALRENVLRFETLRLDPITIERVKAVDYNKIEVDFSGYIGELNSSDVTAGGVAASSVKIEKNPENYAAHRAIVTFDEVLGAGEGTLELSGGKDEYGRSLAGLSGVYTLDDRVYVASVDFSLTGGEVNTEVSIALPKESAINDISVYAAYYEESDRLSDVTRTNYEGIAKGSVVKVSGGKIDTSSAGAGAVIKVLIWDKSTMRPLCQEIKVMKPITIHLVGDSKVCEYRDTSFPQQGWGHYLGELLIDSASVNNRAQSGATTTTFRTGKIRTDSENPDEIVYDTYRAWDQITGVIKSGDYVIIDLAHNDKYSTSSGKNDIPAYKENIRGYVNEIRGYNATPILMSTVPHLRGTGTNDLTDYGEAMKEVAQEMGTVFMDINAISYGIFEEMGIENARYTFYLSNRAMKEVYHMTDDEIAAVPSSSVQNNGFDYIHFNMGGARKVAEIVAGELAKCNDSIAEYVKK